MPETLQLQIPAEAAPAQATPAPSNMILGKFKDVDSLSKAYTELEKKLGSAQPAASQPAAAPVPVTTPAPVPAAQPTIDKFEQEFSQNGKLSDESYTELATKHNLSREVVDRYISAQQSHATNVVNEARKQVFEIVGGEQQYDQLRVWASTALNDGEKKAFNDAINSGNTENLKLAVAGLKAKQDATFGREPNLVNGHASGSGIAPFRSNAEVVAAMGDKRYANDPAYRKDVEARMSVSFL